MSLAATNADYAERLVRLIIDLPMKALALANLAVSLAAADPDRAAQLAEYALGRG